MKILLYKEDYELVKDSGVGKAIVHQERALQAAGVHYTTDVHDTFDLVHINTVLPKTKAFVRRIKSQVPVVIHAHSTMEDFKDSFMFSNQVAPLFKHWLIHHYNQADRLITPTNYAKSILESYKLRPKITVVSNGIDLNFWKTQEGDREKFDAIYHTAGKKVVISVGLYIKRKGILDFVNMAKAFPDVEFIWFGYTNPNLLPPDIKQAVQTQLANLQFPGYVSSEDLRLAYSSCDLYVFPTYEETEGIVLLEALATDARVLLRDIPIYRELQDGVHVYKAKDAQAFHDKLAAFLAGKLPPTEYAGHELVADKSIEAVGAQLKTIYQEVLDDWH
ncbi:glycosyltransferase family 4 protein [Peptoniphilus equinus]|uniref:Glycosyltransferase family 4 protein n=1 Tax=Peptoniphilus equinus TaxID=3016343 RepID=A0ABY7QX10_9FIRM|nr:glycosyltransferase family 4 protein [Peptoniphilus equinus]WBW50458.1 glycosyltransferase family 4 protein [Peptoniphilus equinus]